MKVAETFLSKWYNLLNLHSLELKIFAMYFLVCLIPLEGEGNGNPLQCSCLENPKDGGPWWAAIHGVAQSRT